MEIQGISSHSIDSTGGNGTQTESYTSLPSPVHLDNPSIDDFAENVSDTLHKENVKLRSPIWEHYDRIMIDGVMKAVCKYCAAKLGGDTKNGTSSLKEHYKRKHQKANIMRQQVLTNNFKRGSSGLTSYTFDTSTARKELASAIIMHEYPLSIVEHVGFRRYSMALQPLFKVPCRNTIKNDIFKIYEYEKLNTLSLVSANASRLAITTDMWTSTNQKKGFMAVTTHFIDDSWTLQSRILRFIYVPCPHTKEVLCDFLYECLMDWNIDRKISCVVVDNCSTNDAMIQLLEEKLDSTSLLLGGDLFHMRRAAHILNLTMKDGLDMIKVGIDKIRQSVGYWIGSPKREEKFEETSRQLNVPCTKKLGLDCATRWNSTFLMLQTALVYKDVFYRLSKRDSQYKSFPSEEEWGFAKEICEKLRIFYKVTELFSGTKYPTTNHCFTNICDIRLALRSWLYCDSEIIREMTTKMVEKFDKYWDVIHGMVGVSAILDPRYKLEVLEFYFEKMYVMDTSVKIEKIKSLCYKLLSEYQKSPMTEGIGENTSQSSVGEGECVSEYELFIRRKKIKTVDYGRADLDHYLAEDVLPPTSGFDVLNWWKANAPKYPVLQGMARDMLAIPVSTVASEFAFSTSGRLVSPHRNRLHPDTMEALMCAQSWLWTRELKGESSSGYATIYEDVDSNGSCVTREE